MTFGGPPRGRTQARKLLGYEGRRTIRKNVGENWANLTC